MKKAETMMDEVIELIRNEEKVKTLKIEKDYEVEGRTASYPIDLYWEFEGGNGIVYKVIIQTRQMDKSVDRNRLFHFANILQDIYGQVMGVIFTQPVYEKIVKDVARDVGIVLYEMTGVNDKPTWQPLIGEVKIEFDKEWAKAEKEKHGLGDQMISYHGEPKESFLYNESGLCVDSIEGIFNDYIKKQEAKNDFSEVAVEHKFTENIYLQTGHPLIPKVKVNAVSFKLTFENIAKVETGEIIQNIFHAALKARLN